MTIHGVRLGRHALEGFRTLSAGFLVFLLLGLVVLWKILHVVAALGLLLGIGGGAVTSITGGLLFFWSWGLAILGLGLGLG